MKKVILVLVVIATMTTSSFGQLNANGVTVLNQTSGSTVTNNQNVVHNWRFNFRQFLQPQLRVSVLGIPVFYKGNGGLLRYISPSNQNAVLMIGSNRALFSTLGNLLLF